VTSEVEPGTAPPLFAADAGRGAEPLVLLHGFGAWHGVWESLATGLAGRVLAYDLPGHGRSLDFPGAGPAKLAAGAILADLSRRGIDRVHLCGHSMGGAIATLMALSAPARVRSLSLLAPGGFGEEIDGSLLRRYAAARSESELAEALSAMAGPHASIPTAGLAGLAAMRALPGQTEKLIGIAEAISRGNRQGVIGRTALEGLGMPVMVLWGTEDPVLPWRQTHGLPSRFALDGIAGAGHMLIEEAPETVLRAIRATTRRLGPFGGALP
jgi:pyruvate dehydrogenase E2 component (dihydrolipoamide acetyltransferase)